MEGTPYKIFSSNWHNTYNATSQSTAVDINFISSVETVITEFINPSNKPSDLTARTYPHVFDEAEAGGKVRISLQKAIEAANEALEAFNVPDLGSVASKLTTVALNIATAQTFNNFNPALTSILGYMRRSALITDISLLDRASLNAFILVLNFVSNNLLLDINEAADQTELLVKNHWNGDLAIVSELISQISSMDESTPTTVEKIT